MLSSLWSYHHHNVNRIMNHIMLHVVLLHTQHNNIASYYDSLTTDIMNLIKLYSIYQSNQLILQSDICIHISVRSVTRQLKH